MKKAIIFILCFILCFTSCLCLASCEEKEKTEGNGKTDSTAKDEVSVQFTQTDGTAANTLSAEDNESDKEEGEEKPTATKSEAVEALPLRHANVEVEGYGVIKLALDPNYAPITVDNFINLAESGFYNGLTFHRIMEGFMIQGGDPNHNSTGGSGKNIKGEFRINGVNNTLSHKRGVISMARSGAYNSASSQFFICHDDALFLDGQYAAFGWVTEGMEVVDAIAEAASPTDDNGTIPFEEQPVITKITVID